ncbi:Protein of unknown function [Gryllus bimaculatus]|nr:Protein of unknown function [Gryllus bimaculatus]
MRTGACCGWPNRRGMQLRLRPSARQRVSGALYLESMAMRHHSVVRAPSGRSRHPPQLSDTHKFTPACIFPSPASSRD